MNFYLPKLGEDEQKGQLMDVGVIYLANGIIYLANGIIYLANDVIYLANDVIYLANGIIYLANDVIYLANGIIYLANDVIYLANGIIYLAKKTHKPSYCDISTSSLLMGGFALPSQHFWFCPRFFNGIARPEALGSISVDILAQGKRIELPMTAHSFLSTLGQAQRMGSRYSEGLNMIHLSECQKLWKRRFQKNLETKINFKVPC